MDALTYYHMIPLNICLVLGLLFLLTGLSHRLCPKINSFFNFGRSKVKGGPGNGAGTPCAGTGSTQGYNPILVPAKLGRVPSSGSNNNNGGGMQSLRALENSKAIWIRVGIFSLVHTLPLASVVGSIAYELSGREDWEAGRGTPNLQIFLLRLNMNLIAGLTTGKGRDKERHLALVDCSPLC
jgi:hypothetical protein